MRLLLDTHILLWALGQPRKLSKLVRQQIEDAENEVFYSPASIWEIAIKNTLGRSDFRAEPEAVVHALHESGFAELPIRAHHAVAMVALPAIHKDPFDRMLIAQARSEPMVLLTRDRVLTAYPATIQLVP